MGTGEGKNRKIAEAAAAEAALIALKAMEAGEAKNEEDYPTLLRSYSAKSKLKAPEFCDLGESEKSDSYAREYLFSCKVGAYEEIGKGRSKSEARCAAAKSMLNRLKGKQ